MAAREVLRVVGPADLGSRPVIKRESDFVGPLFFSVGDIDLVCGNCDFLLLKGVRGSEAIFDALVLCPNCGAWNESWNAMEDPTEGLNTAG